MRRKRDDAHQRTITITMTSRIPSTPPFHNILCLSDQKLGLGVLVRPSRFAHMLRVHPRFRDTNLQAQFEGSPEI